MQYTWQLALVLVPVYFIKHSVSCYIYYIHTTVQVRHKIIEGLTEILRMEVSKLVGLKHKHEGELPVYCIKHEDFSCYMYVFYITTTPYLPCNNNNYNTEGTV